MSKLNRAVCTALNIAPEVPGLSCLLDTPLVEGAGSLDVLGSAGDMARAAGELSGLVTVALTLLLAVAGLLDLVPISLAE